MLINGYYPRKRVLYPYIFIYILDFMILFNMAESIIPKMGYTFTVINKNILDLLILFIMAQIFMALGASDLGKVCIFYITIPKKEGSDAPSAFG